MANEQNSSLIGYDPLAWMAQTNTEEPSDNDEHKSQVSGSSAELIQEPLLVESEFVEQRSIQETTAESAEVASHDGSVVLEPVLTIQQVNGLHDQLLKLFEAQDKIEVDASAVTTIDTATMQLLLVAKRQAVKMGKELNLNFPSDKFLASVELLGLTQLLNLEKPESGLF